MTVDKDVENGSVTVSPKRAEKGENKFTFKMPGSKVTIEATFRAVEKGVTTGATDTLFVPDADCTRGQIVTFLYRDAQ